MKTVVITGSARGLGLEMAKVFRKNNLNVVISDLNIENLTKAESILKEIEVESKIGLCICDVTKSSDILNLIEYTNNKVLMTEITENYKELEEKISIMDADLRSIVKTAEKEKKSTTLVVSSNLFKFLENYGFNVIALEDEENLTENNLNSIKSNFKNNSYNTIIMSNKDKTTDLIESLVKDYKAKITIIDTMNTLSEENKTNNQNYLSLTQQYIDNIRNIILK